MMVQNFLSRTTNENKINVTSHTCEELLIFLELNSTSFVVKLCGHNAIILNRLFAIYVPMLIFFLGTYLYDTYVSTTMMILK